MENDEPLQSNEYLYKSNCNNDIENNIEEIEVPEFTMEHVQEIDDNYKNSLSHFNDFNIHTYEIHYEQSATELYDLFTVNELYTEHLNNIELLQIKVDDYNSLKICELNNNQINTEKQITEYLNKKKYKRQMYLEEILPLIINDAENLEEAAIILENI
jgi:hypothetical protein